MSTNLESLASALEDRYRIERELGYGGMATVFLAEDLKHGRRVAIKVMNPLVAAAIGPDRFLREIEIVARLTHPHILALHDSGAAKGQLYYVTPYIEGGSLRGLLDREKQLSIAEAMRLTREIANGLGHAHHRGVVHRDVKPENILLADGIALVADFGIARPTETSPKLRMTTMGVALGTPQYMAPEQIMGSPEIDARADLYALGCVLYEMLAGQPPFTGTREALAYQHVSVEPSPVTDHRPDAPPGIAAMLATALSKAPADRFATAARFAEALDVALLETPVPPKKEVEVPNNLPRSRTSFVGREAELAECARLMGESRLLTLIGVGGCGKTRLALRLAEHLLESHPDGVWFVNLAPVASPERVPQSVAAAAGIPEEMGKPLAETLVQRLRGKQALLVLDNCEHLLSACAELADALLSSCPSIQLLATSREGLGVEGERPYAVRSLPVPRREAHPSLDEAASNDSVRLFVDRARQASPDFALSAESVSDVAEICRRLDGIPLAIELAAARIQILSLEQIRAMLDDRFRLLTGGTKALPRHQTLRATIQWSYDHLTPEMRHLFERLSVFDGGWTLAAAAAVMGEGTDEFEVLDLMSGLVNKSLVLVGREGRMPRYRMLETIRQFAQEQLGESGEGDGTRDLHLGWTLEMVEEAESHLYGAEQTEWFRRLDLELENVLGAHAWCDRAPGGAEKGLRLAAGMRLFWITRGLFNLGIRTTREALSRSAPESAKAARARALLSGGLLATRMGDHQTARAYLEEGLPIFRALGERSGESRSLSFLGVATFALGDAATAHRHLEDAVAIAQGIDKVTALNGLASILTVEGETARAIPLYEQALSMARELDSLRQIANSLENLAMARVLREDYQAARANLSEAFELSEKASLVVSRQGVLEVISRLAGALEEPERAARLRGAADAMLERLGTQCYPLRERILHPLVTRTRESKNPAALALAYGEGRALKDEAVTAEVRAWLGSGDA